MHPGIRCYNADSCLKKFMGMSMKCENMCKHITLYYILVVQLFRKHHRCIEGVKVEDKFVSYHKIKT